MKSLQVVFENISISNSVSLRPIYDVSASICTTDYFQTLQAYTSEMLSG